MSEKYLKICPSSHAPLLLWAEEVEPWLTTQWQTEKKHILLAEDKHTFLTCLPLVGTLVPHFLTCSQLVGAYLTLLDLPCSAADNLWVGIELGLPTRLG